MHWFLRGVTPSRSPLKLFLRGVTPSRSPLKLFLRGVTPSRSPLKLFLRGVTPSRSPLKAPREHAQKGKIRAIIATLGEICGLAGVALCTLAAWLPAEAAGRPAALTAGWYSVEVIVFQRAEATPADSPEHLYRTDPRSLPAGIVSIAADTPGSAYRLSPLAAATLEFPTLSRDCAAAGDAARRATPGVAARYPPAWQGAGEGAAPPAPFDIPVAPRQSRPVCSLAPGLPPPAIEPVLEPHPLLARLNATRRFERQLRADSYRAAGDGLALRREANRIRNAGGLRLLWHGRWTQPVPPRNAPEPLLLQAGRQDGGSHQLEGTLAITMGRYLHFNARLWWTGAAGTRSSLSGDTFGLPEGSGSGTQTPAPERRPHMVLEESRAMRSGTLHYLDHPLLGVLVRADPLTPP